MSREVMQQALEALEEAHWKIEHKQDAVKRGQAITALKQALAEPEQEPVGTARELFTNAALEQLDIRPSTTVYLGAPTPRKPQTTHWEGCEAVHPECRKPEQEPDGISWLKRDSGYFTAPTPQREHITDGSPCWCNPDVFEEDGGNVIVHNYEDNWQQYAKPGETAQQCIERHRSEQDALMKLYATPRKPLTDEEIEALWQNTSPYYDHQDFARAIERAHGIGEQT